MTKIYVFFGAAGLAAVGLQLAAHGEHGHGVLALPGFLLGFGLAGAALLAVFAKKLLFPVVKRPLDYYGEEEV